MSRCVDCRNVRAFARHVGGFRAWWRSLWALCWAHWMRRNSLLHIAGRVALALVVTVCVAWVLVGACWCVYVALAPLVR